LRDGEGRSVAVSVGLKEARRITVVGCGHVGLVIAAGFAKLGHSATGLERSPDLVGMLAEGHVPFHEAGLPELVQDGIQAGRLRFTTSYADAVPGAEFIFLTVDTPGTLVGAADHRNIRAAARDIAGSLNGTSPIIVNKSTSPIGTGDTIEGILRRDLAEAHKRPRIVSKDALAVLADWPQFADIPMDEVRRAMRGDTVLDGRNTLNADEVNAHGFTYIGVGRRSPASFPLAAARALVGASG